MRYKIEDKIIEYPSRMNRTKRLRHKITQQGLTWHKIQQNEPNLSFSSLVSPMDNFELLLVGT